MPLTPRLLSHGEAATYCGMSVPHFDAHIAPHVPALEFGRKRLWDRHALDAHIDRLSGLGDLTSTEDWLSRA